MQRFIARLAIEPGIAGVTVTSAAPWDGVSATLEADGVVAAAKRAAIMTVDTSFFKLFGARMLQGRAFTASDVRLRDANRPVVVNRSFVAEVLGGGEAVGRRVRYQSFSNDPQPWMTIAGVVEDFPPGIRNASESTKRSTASARRWRGSRKRPSAKRARASLRKLKREPRRAASHQALSRQATTAARRR